METVHERPRVTREIEKSAYSAKESPHKLSHYDFGKAFLWFVWTFSWLTVGLQRYT